MHQNDLGGCRGSALPGAVGDDQLTPPPGRSGIEPRADAPARPRPGHRAGKRGHGEAGGCRAVEDGCHDPGRDEGERRQHADVAFDVAVTAGDRREAGDAALRQMLDPLAFRNRWS